MTFEDFETEVEQTKLCRLQPQPPRQAHLPSMESWKFSSVVVSFPLIVRHVWTYLLLGLNIRITTDTLAGHSTVTSMISAIVNPKFGSSVL